jgi:hypothetical protein
MFVCAIAGDVTAAARIVSSIPFVTFGKQILLLVRTSLFFCLSPLVGCSVNRFLLNFLWFRKRR